MTAATLSGGRREATKLANREAILDAARGVFVEVGYGAANVRDIVRRTHLATGTFYNYFPDKEAVFLALLEDVALEVRAQVEAARARASTGEEFVARGFRAYFEFLARDRATLQLILRNAGTVRKLFDEPALGAGMQELRRDLEQAVRAGLMPPIDADYMAAAMVGAAFEVGLRMIERQPADIEGATSFATNLFTAAIGQATAT